ncbi:VOC family protein [Sphingoaurantiacus capsulatus]|uniref:VOC family protein n=1 Tax=Sphingoaurantiacus capsulatus TaxID=1771310 RepID=A0ABV7XB47_9SPHN
MRLILNIDVEDQARAEAFYTAALGLHVGRRWDGMTELLGAEALIYLLQKDGGTPIGPDGGDTRRYDRHWTPVHIDLAVDDLDAAVTRALAAGAVQEGELREANWGRIAMFADPFGHGFCLLQFKGRGYDEIPHA